MESKSCLSRVSTGHGAHLHQSGSAAVFGSDLHHGFVGSRINLSDDVFTRGQGRITGIKLKRNVRDQLPATIILRLGRHGHRTHENQQRDYCVSLLFHFRISFCAAPSLTVGFLPYCRGG